MSVTIDLDDTESIQLTETDVERRPPDRLEFAVEGSLTVTPDLLANFEGATLDPVQVTVSSGDADPVAIDLTDAATLRLETVDVGVATPDGEDVAEGLGAVASTATGNGGSVDSPPGVISFSVDGVLRDVPTATLEAVGNDAPELESLTFAVEESLRSDGGSDDDNVVFELTLLGYGIVVRRDGSIVVGTDGPLDSIDLP
ncbi:hypothetical protein [Haloterrigena alkaliphila]|uniref:Uncharacterized protein n=1 Tax=Haloterrigena alkaliphila TaxID=2816475 RepID=A0A8A2VFT1_9EURY|nr:hypothetical protein [Haloterrigena alkaliphila]QSW99560.1 hypothetical protein J0X25_00960 [Haloterrigena alkaliphila]